MKKDIVLKKEKLRPKVRRQSAQQTKVVKSNKKDKMEKYYQEVRKKYGIDYPWDY